jgi:PPOX class probable F420-dependent enzyme
MNDAVLQLAAANNIATLATIKRDGRPQLSNVNYHFDPEAMLVRISVVDGRAKVANLRRDPRASLLINGDGGWTYGVLEGDAEFSEVTRAVDDAPAQELVDVFRDVAGKEHPDWDEYRQAMVDDQRLVLRIRVTHAYGMASR